MDENRGIFGNSSGEPLRRYAPPPLTGEALLFPLKGGMSALLTRGFPRRGDDPSLAGCSRKFPPCHCEPVLTLACPEEMPLGYGNPFSWQKTTMFHRTLGAAGQQSLPCVKGGGVRKDTGGIDAEQFTFCNANSDYSMSKNQTTHSRELLLASRCAAERAWED